MLKIQKQREAAQATQNIQVNQPEEEDEDMGDDIIDDLQEPAGNPETCLVAFKQMIVSILEDNELDQKRAAKMEILDFLNLLNLFNSKGIHFK